MTFCLLLALALCAATAALVPPALAVDMQELSREAGERFGKRRPRHWGDAMPGIVSRFDPKTLPDAGADAGTPVEAEQPSGLREQESPLIVALTLDACGPRPGHSSYDAAIIAYLREQRIPATIFVTSSWMRANPKPLADLAADPLFELAAHGAKHRPCSVNGRSVFGIKGTANISELILEVEGNAASIAEATGKRPRWFRSGTAYYDDVAVEIIHWLNLGIAGFSVAADQGATLPASEVARRVAKAKPGDIILCHLNHPESGTGRGLTAGLGALNKKGARFVRLSDIPGLLVPEAAPDDAGSAETPPPPVP